MGFYRPSPFELIATLESEYLPLLAVHTCTHLKLTNTTKTKQKNDMVASHSVSSNTKHNLSNVEYQKPEKP